MKAKGRHFEQTYPVVQLRLFPRQPLGLMNNFQPIPAFMLLFLQMSFIYVIELSLMEFDSSKSMA